MINLAANERPRRFKDAIGQETNAKILASMSMKEAYAKAYLFEGMHGCGKTTLARVTAMSANCTNKQSDGEPCGECEMCRKIMKGEEIDVVEIDAASNNSVERARELIEESRFRPLECRTKVYIIDEAHMLSNGAFNALLKLLEEPPEWCMYILCTTAKAKIPGTILSRCASFNFKAVTYEKIAEHLKCVAEKYSCTITDDAAYSIASHSGGSVRDAMRDLEKCLSETVEIGIGDVTEALGIEPYEQVFRLITAIADNDSPEIIGACERYRAEGKDMLLVLSDAVSVLTDLVMVTAGGKLTGRGEGYMSLLGELAEEITLEKALYLSKRLAEVRKSAGSVFEPALITVELLRTATANEQSLEALEIKVHDLEERLARLEAGCTAPEETHVKQAEALVSSDVRDTEPAQTEKEQRATEEESPIGNGFSVMSSNSECPFDSGDVAYWKQVMAIAETIPMEVEQDGRPEEMVETVAVVAESVPEEAAGEPEKAGDCVSTVQNITNTGFGGIFDLFSGFGSPKAATERLAESFADRLDKIKTEDRQAKAVLDAAGEVNVYKDCVEVVSIGYMETVTRQALAKYDFIKVVTMD